MSERVGFFDAAFDAVEYDPDRRADGRRPATAVLPGPPLRPGLGRGRRGAGRRSPGLHRRHRPVGRSVEDAVRDADLLLVESRARSASRRRPRTRPPDGGRGDRAGQVGRGRGPRCSSTSTRSACAELEALCAAAGPWVRPAIDGLTVTVSPARRADGRPTGRRRPPTPTADAGRGAQPGLGRPPGPAEAAARALGGALAIDGRGRGVLGRAEVGCLLPERRGLRRRPERQRGLGRLAQQRKGAGRVARCHPMRRRSARGRPLAGWRSRWSASRAWRVRRRLASRPA